MRQSRCCASSARGWEVASGRKPSCDAASHPLPHKIHNPHPCVYFVCPRQQHEERGFSVSTRKMVRVALLVTISVVLTRWFSIMLPIAGALGVRLSLGEIPLFLAGVLFGPLAGGVAGAIADVIGVAIAPMGSFFPGFTISAAMAGAIPGLILHRRRRNITMGWLVGTVAVTGLLVTLLNTYWLVILLQRGVYVLLPPRLFSRLAVIPIHSLIICALHTRIHIFKEHPGT